MNTVLQSCSNHPSGSGETVQKAFAQEFQLEDLCKCYANIDSTLEFDGATLTVQN